MKPAMRHCFSICGFSLMLAYGGMSRSAIAAPVPATALSVVDSPALQAQAGDYVIPDFAFSDGTVLPAVRIHYVTLGTPHHDAHGQIDNAVLLMHGTTGTGQAFLTPLMKRELFAAGQPLDTAKYYIVIPDGLGRGASSKPSDGLRMRFPHYGYNDVVEANHRMLVDGLHVNHLRLVLGTSMGGMQTWVWGERYPDMADALMPIASQPIAMAGRNWLWRQMIVGAIRNDPGWQGGDYAVEPTQWLRVMPIFNVITGNAARFQEQAPDRVAATQLYDGIITQAAHNDANDVLYWFESSWDYDPAPQLSRIRAPLYAVNFADDLINAADLGAMQAHIGQVAHGRYIEIPEGPNSYGHQTLTQPQVWKPYLIDLLAHSGGAGTR